MPLGSLSGAVQARVTPTMVSISTLMSCRLTDKTEVGTVHMPTVSDSNFHSKPPSIDAL